MGNINLNAASGGVITLAPTNTVSNYTVSVPATTATLAIENASTTGSALSVKSNATTGVLQVVGPVAASTRVMTTPDANFSVARTDALQTLTGNQTITNGNVIVSSGYGIDFSATAQAGGMTSELLADYEEGTWTPSDESGAGLTFTSVVGRYIKVGKLVTLWCTFTYPSTSDSAHYVYVGGLPFTSDSTLGGGMVTVNNGTQYLWNIGENVTASYLGNGPYGGLFLNSNLSTVAFKFVGSYQSV
jgi:hypothetical protein